MLIVISALLLGIITGAVNADGLDGEKANEIYNLTNQSVLSGSLHYAFLKSLSIQFTRFIIIFLCGITVIGSPVATFYTGYLGFSLGFSSAFLFKYYGFSGILSILLGILPHYVILIPLYLFMTAMSINFSNALLREDKTLRDSLRNYSVKMLVFAVIIFITCLIEGYISAFFLKTIIGFIK